MLFADIIEMERFTHAIARKPCPGMVNGLSTAGLGLPDFQLAEQQHSAYLSLLRECGLQVTCLEPDLRYPDSVFIEDVALCTPTFAVVTRPGAPSRAGETAGIREVLSAWYEDIEQIAEPGTVEAGDVLMTDGHFFIGLSKRTNEEGAGQLAGMLRKYGYGASVVRTGDLLHLKTGVSCLDANTLLVSGELAGLPEFAAFRKLIVPESESYAANAIQVNGTVIIPDGFPLTREMLEQSGYKVRVAEVSEYRKLDGGLSCLSLRFTKPAAGELRLENALANFRSGLNCAQAVVGAYAASHGQDRDAALAVSAGFGGGMGRMQETCGVLTGAYMAIGMHNSALYGDIIQRKEKSYEMVREFTQRFLEVHPSVRCIDLLGENMQTEEGRNAIKMKNLHDTVCERCMMTGIRLLNELTSPERHPDA